ncbi:MAG: hypothetical protein JEZ11_26525 [Desulfobacterales bacterium]|nr:hypothetical protein [Desulfobacterales bacterium]
MLFDKLRAALMPGRSSGDRKVRAEMERIALETGAEIPMNRKFKKELVKPYRQAVQYLSGIAEAIGEPAELDAAKWDDMPLLKALFVNPRELTSLLATHQGLHGFFKENRSAEAYALLTAVKRTRKVVTTAEEGGIVHRDVLQENVFFEAVDLIGPSPDMDRARDGFVHHAMAAFFGLSRIEVADLKSWKKELEEQRERLKFKIGTPARPGAESPRPPAKDEKDAEARRVLSGLVRKIEEIEQSVDSPEGHFDRLNDLLLHPERHLKAKTAYLKMGHMGSWIAARAAGPEDVLAITQLESDDGPPKAAVWVRIDRAALPSPK